MRRIRWLAAGVVALLATACAEGSGGAEAHPGTDVAPDAAADIPGDLAPDPDPVPDPVPDPDPEPEPVPDALPDPAPDLAPEAASDVPAVIPAKAWGWISVIEVNDSCDQWYLKTHWFGGLRAYFASGPNYNRALPHTLQFAKAVDSEGDCTLYDSGLMNDECLGMCACLDKGVECYSYDEIERWCPEDQFCVVNPDLPPGGFDHGLCRDLPPHFDVGAVTISGLKVPVAMTPDELDRYIATGLPDDLFDAGDAITATTSGGALPPLTFHATGVAPLAVPDPVVTVRKDEPSVLAWTPADPAARIQVVLNAGSHDPNPLGGAIVCDAPDGQGQVEVAWRLLERLFYLGCNGTWLMKCSRVTRYSRDVQATLDSQVELFVGSARNVQIDWTQMF